MYSIFGYGEMISDNGRMAPYTQALQQAIQPGSVVLDIGIGTGIFSVLACHYGAKKVYSIEPADAIQVAKVVAQQNNCADRIEFIQAISTEVNLPEEVDIIISDLRGVLPLFQQHIFSIADARQRFLKSGGIQIPQQDTIWLTLICDSERYKKYLSPWEDQPYGCILTANRKFVTNTWQKASFKPEQIIGKPQVWATLDYTLLKQPNFKETITWRVTESRILHGLGGWFDTILLGDIGFSNAPGQPECIYGNAFFPLSNPVEVDEGDVVTVTLQANLAGNDYIWSWHTTVISGDASRQIKANFKQSTFFGSPLSPAQLRKQSDQFIPKLNQTAKIDFWILGQMQQQQSLGDIATSLADKYGDRFPSYRQALTYLGELAQRYSE